MNRPGSRKEPDGREVPWYAVAVPPGPRNPALRPVPEDEPEELDETFAAWDVTSLGPDFRDAEARAMRDGGSEGNADERVDDSGTGRPRREGADSDGTPASPDAWRRTTRVVGAAVGRAVRIRRTELGESQAEYGRRTGRDQARVSRIERGLRPLTIADLAQIAVETGRTIRCGIVPDGASRESEGQHTQFADLVGGGTVWIVLGPRPPATNGSSEGTYRLPYTIS
jgi:hypothetical protein